MRLPSTTDPTSDAANAGCPLDFCVTHEAHEIYHAIQGSGYFEGDHSVPNRFSEEDQATALGRIEVLSYIETIGDSFGDELTWCCSRPSMEEYYRKYTLEHLARAKRHPLGCACSASVSVALNGFFDGIEAEDIDISHFLDSFEFFRSSTVGAYRNTDRKLLVDLIQSTFTVNEWPSSFHLPVLLVTERTNEGVDGLETKNAQRVMCASAAYFLSKMGVYDTPVFGLRVKGQSGEVISAWCSKVRRILVRHIYISV